LDRSPVARQLKAFIAAKEAQARALAKADGTELPAEFAVFFAAADRGDVGSVTNLLDTLRQRYPQILSEPAWQPALEVGGALEVLATAGDANAISFSKDVIASIPPGSVFFGGTDWGRFLITALSTSQIQADPFFTITLKSFGPIEVRSISRKDNLGYLRSMYGQRLRIPSEQDVQKCFQDYVREVQARQAAGQKISADEQVTTVDGTIQVRGALGAMNINAGIAKLIFDENPDRQFYVEESYVIPWMFPYVEPHRLILKLNRKPLAQLDPAVIAKDRVFWDGLTNQLMADPEFLNNKPTRRCYSKLRSAIGGVYAYRKLTDEAEYAFRQAVRLDPANPEPNFRLAQLYITMNRVDDAITVLKALQRLDPTEQKIQAALDQLQTMKQSGQRNAEGR
jgi:tetratricopeptide (TPR) repeat protein